MEKKYFNFLNLSENLSKEIIDFVEKIVLIQHSLIKNYLTSKNEDITHIDRKILDKYNIRYIQVEKKNIYMLWAGQELLFKMDYDNMMYHNPKYYKEKK